MPVFALGNELIFPHPSLREPDGLLAFGGDLSPERLLLAYRWGIFPWFNEGSPVLWWWLSPRMVLRPSEIHVSRSLQKTMNKGRFRVTINQHFREVMLHCAGIPRKGQDGTWITGDMLEAYTRLHSLGFAHSVEVSDETGLVGGIYGVALGHIFFGESMFSAKPNMSKVALVFLSRHLASKGFQWIDCQQDTRHLRSMGATLMDETEFLSVLRENQEFMFRQGHLVVGSAFEMPD